MATKDRQFLAISPAYQYRTLTTHKLRKPRPSTKHNRHNSTLKAYRAFDKEQLLQQIDSKLQKQNRAIEENRFLKQKMTNMANYVPEKTWSHGQINLMMVSIQEENLLLGKEVQERKKEIQEMKRSAGYNQVRQISSACVRYREELGRLKGLIKQRKKEKLDQRRLINKVRNEQLSQITSKQRGIREMEDRNQELRAYLQSIEQQLQNFKDKNKQQIKTKKKLIEDIRSLKVKAKSKGQKGPHLQTVKTYKYDISPFDSAIKTKSSKQTSPMTIMETLEQNESSPIKNDVKRTNLSLNRSQSSSSSNEQYESSNDSNSSQVHSDPEGSYIGGKSRDSF